MSHNIKFRKIICYLGQGYTNEVPIFASKTINPFCLIWKILEKKFVESLLFGKKS